MKKILPFLVICFLAGLLLGRSLDILHQRHFFSAAILILITFFISAAISISRANIFFILICLLFFILGILRYTSFVFPREDDVCFSLNEDPQTVVICGAVEGGIKEKNKEDKIEFLFRAEHILVDDKEKPVSGTICVKTFSL